MRNLWERVRRWWRIWRHGESCDLDHKRWHQCVDDYTSTQCFDDPINYDRVLPGPLCWYCRKCGRAWADSTHIEIRKAPSVVAAEFRSGEGLKFIVFPSKLWDIFSRHYGKVKK